MTTSARPARSLVPHTFQLIHEDLGAVSEFQLQNILILVWQVQPTAAVIAGLEAANESVRRRAVHGMSMINIVHAPLQLPDESARSAMLHFTKGHNVRLVAMVVTQTGFVLSMLRSVVTGLRVLTGGHFDYRICATFEEVADWLPSAHLAKTGVEVERERLINALREAQDHAAGAQSVDAR